MALHAQPRAVCTRNSCAASLRARFAPASGSSVGATHYIAVVMINHNRAEYHLLRRVLMMFAGRKRRSRWIAR